MLDYKNIIIKHYALGMSGSEIADTLGVSKSGVNDFLRAFEKCITLEYPLPEGITNYGIAELVYGRSINMVGRNESYELPDFEYVHGMLTGRKNMTIVFLWNRYMKRCIMEDNKFYQYRQFCELYAKWRESNNETSHFPAVIGQKMEVDFAGKTFKLIDKVTGELTDIVVFVAILPYSQYIYAEGMISTKEPQWIEANNNALDFFGGVPAIVVCDNCKQAVTANRDWISPDLNKDYAEWAEHNHTAILPAKVRKPRYKSSVENAVGILEKGIFHELEERNYFSLSQFNKDLLEKLDELNKAPFKNKEHNRYYYWELEKSELMQLPSMHYEYMERKLAKVSSDFHVRFDNAYYSVDKAFLHKNVSIGATATKVRIYSIQGGLICEWPRATRRGQWMTNPEHLPRNYRDISEWNGPYFIRRAMTIGPNTEAVISAILKSKELEIQTYRLCTGVLGFTKKYSKRALEECCGNAIAMGKPTYSFIKNSIAAIAEELGPHGYNTDVADDRNKGAFVMAPEATDLSNLLLRSEALVHKSRKEAKTDEED